MSMAAKCVGDMFSKWLEAGKPITTQQVRRFQEKFREDWSVAVGCNWERQVASLSTLHAYLQAVARDGPSNPDYDELLEGIVHGTFVGGSSRLPGLLSAADFAPACFMGHAPRVREKFVRVAFEVLLSSDEYPPLLRRQLFRVLVRRDVVESDWRPRETLDWGWRNSWSRLQPLLLGNATQVLADIRISLAETHTAALAAETEDSPVKADSGASCVNDHRAEQSPNLSAQPPSHSVAHSPAPSNDRRCPLSAAAVEDGAPLTAREVWNRARVQGAALGIQHDHELQATIPDADSTVAPASPSSTSPRHASATRSP